MTIYCVCGQAFELAGNMTGHMMATCPRCKLEIRINYTADKEAFENCDFTAKPKQ